MIPYKFGTSDGLFNIGALAYVQTLSHGVYIAMNGRVFLYNKVIKNRKTGILRNKMKDVTIYHNPRCSKSRQTLQIIKDHGIQPIVVEYLKVSLKKSELDNISAAK